ncbi:unnamed protein product, partial [Iphiclides podalirius]
MKLAMISIHIFCSMVLSGTDMAATQRISSLLSRLFNSATQNNRPLVLIIDRSNLRDEPKYPLKPSNLVDTSLESDEGIPPAVYLLQSQGSGSQKGVLPIHEVGHNLYHGPHSLPKGRLQKQRAIKGQMRVVGTTPSPVLKTLLSFDGKKRFVCQIKCEENYQCQPEQSADPCESDDDDCGEEEDKNPSTKGERLVTDKPDCVRC